MARRKTDSKADALRKHGCLHPHPEKVTDKLFASSAFFDSQDLVQVKYEMLRRVQTDGYSITQAAADFGLSRPSFYQAQSAYDEGGLPALLPKKTGPRRAHKLSEHIVEALCEMRDEEPHISASALAEFVTECFGVSVHPRSIGRALDRQAKKSQP